MAGKRSSLYADLDHLRSMFTSVDPQNTGYIGFKELQVLAENNAGMEETMVALVQEKLDRDRDGKISFEDFQEIFELERESIKRQRLETFPDVGHSSTDRVSKLPLIAVGKCSGTEKPAKLTFSIGQRSPVELRRASADSMSPVSHDLATQMRHLTNIPESPRINRASKVLSWISESDDMFEGTGISEEQTDGFLSPPMSPRRVSGAAGADVDNVCTIIKDVCQTEHIGPDAIQRLCAHVDTDDQEQEMLLTLVKELDTEGKGYVSVEDFVDGLQGLVASTSEEIHPKQTTMSFSRFMEPLSTTPTSQRTTAYQTSTPLASQRKNLQSVSSELTILDPKNSGYVGVDTLAQQWQNMGVEIPHDQKLEDTLSESLVIDASRRVNVSDVATTLESAVMNDSQNSTLRHAALLTFKGEINNLRTLLHQASMERDGLVSTLQRTVEESKRMVMEGDEQVERITKESERIAWENQQRLSERLREVEREKEEEAKHLQELMDVQKEKYKREIEELKLREDELKNELKIKVSEANKRNMWDRQERESEYNGDRSEKPEVETDETNYKLQELEQENASLIEQSKTLQELNRSLQDRNDELMADNEKLKQKYTSHKRKLQRAQSLQKTPQTSEGRKRAQSAKRPSSANRRLTPLSSMEIDIEPPYLGIMEELEKDEEDMESEASNGLTSSSDDAYYGKSTTSLLEEMQSEDAKIVLERKLEELTREKQFLEENYYMFQDELQRQNDKSDFEMSKQRRRQKELQKQIQSLEDQKRKLCSTKDGIRYQLETMESNLVKQLADIHKLQQKVSGAEVDVFGSGNSNHSTQPTESKTNVGFPTADKNVGSEVEYTISPQYGQEIAELQQQLQDLSAEKENLLLGHNEAVEKLKSDAKAKEEEIQERYKTTVLSLQRECETCRVEAEQYKNEVDSLKVQVSMLENEQKIKEMEVRQLKERQQRKVLPLLPVQAAEKKELMRLKEENENLTMEVKKQVKEVWRIKDLHAHQQMQHDTEVDKRKKIYKEELEKMKNDYESRIAKLKVSVSQENISSRKIRDESVEQDLKVCRLTIDKLKNRVEAAETQCENLIEELSRERADVKGMEKQMRELEKLHAEAQKEVCDITREREKIQLELIECKQALHSELQKQHEMVVEESVMSSMPDVEQMAAPVYSTPPPTTHSDHHSNHEIVSQMKQQLEDLQVCLVQQNTSPSKKNESTLIHELLAMNKILKDELEKEQIRQEEKEANIKSLAARENAQIHTVQKLQQAVGLLQQNCESCILTLDDRIQAVNGAVNYLMNKVKQRIHQTHAQPFHSTVLPEESTIVQKSELVSDDITTNENDHEMEGEANLTMEICSLRMELCNRESEVKDLQNRLQTYVREPVEVVHYMESVPQFSVNDVFLASVQEGSAQIEQHEVVEQVSLESRVEEQMMQQEATVIMENGLMNKEQGESGTQLTLKSSVTDYSHVSHNSADKITTLQRQLLEERSLRLEAERNLEKNMAEWQSQETQWLQEHEEEVRALKQRNERLSQVLQLTREQYEDISRDQQIETSEIIQELIAKQTHLENELEERTRQMGHGSTPSDGATDEKLVLMNILEELCTQCFTDEL